MSARGSRYPRVDEQATVAGSIDRCAAVRRKLAALAEQLDLEHLRALAAVAEAMSARER